MIVVSSKVTSGVKRLAISFAIGAVSVLAQTSSPTDFDTHRLSPQEQRGKEIYFGTGSSADPPIKALIGNPATEVQGTLMACYNCHGEDGTGKPEGGVVPSNITWDALTKPYGVTHSSGRTHSPYTSQLIIRAVCMGIDPTGNQIHVAMPRFRMSRDDANALIAYLKRLGKDEDPGVSDSAIRVGTILPRTGSAVAAGQAMASALSAYFHEINKQGGVYGRKIELVVADPGETPSQSSTNIERFIEEKRPFVLVAGLMTGFEKEAVEACEKNRVPFIGPLTVLTETGYQAKPHTFYLLSGIEEQARALIDYSRSTLKAPRSRIVIVYSEKAVRLDIVERIQRYCKESGWSSITLLNSGTATDSSVKELIGVGQAPVLLLDYSLEAVRLANEEKKTGFNPILLIPGSLATNALLDLGSAVENKVFLALPSLPSDQTAAGASEYRTLASRYDLPGDQIASEIAALCAAKVLVHALKVAGKTISRDKLVSVLEGLTDFDTGFTPRIGFGPNRRVGAHGAYIVTIDPHKKNFTPVTGWVRLE